MGHIADRPPIEAIEEGSHCITCNIFLPKEDALRALEGPLCRNHVNGDGMPTVPNLHHPNCGRLQVRIPLEGRTVLTGSWSSYRSIRRESSRVEEDDDEAEEDDQEGEEDATQTQTRHHNWKTPSSKQQQSRLLSLPTELLLEIASYLFPVFPPELQIMPLARDSPHLTTYPRLRYPPQPSSPSSPTPPPTTTFLSLLSTSLTLHTTLLPLLYPPSTTFNFPSSSTLYLFLRHISHAGRLALRHLSLPFSPSRSDAPTLALLSTCPNLRSLTLRIPRAVLLDPRPSLWQIESLATLLEISGLERVEFAGGGGGNTTYMDSTHADGQFLIEKLTRPRGSPSGVRWVGGYPDI